MLIDFQSDARSAYPGLLPSTRYGREMFGFENIFSRRIVGAPVSFGLAVGAGTDDGTVTLGGNGFIGITVADETQATGDYQVGITAGCLNKGYIWVQPATTLTPADPIYFDPATGQITNIATGNTAIPNATAQNTTDASGLTLLFLG